MVSPLGAGVMVSRCWVETIIEIDRKKQADLEGEAGRELVDDLPWSESWLVRVGTSQVEVELVKGSLGQEVGPVLESFQIKELVPLCGMRRWRVSTSLW